MYSIIIHLYPPFVAGFSFISHPHIASHPADPDTKGEGFDEATPDAQRHSASPTGVDATQRRRGIRHVRRELQNLVLWRGEFWEKLDHRKYEKLGIMMWISTQDWNRFDLIREIDAHTFLCVCIYIYIYVCMCVYKYLIYDITAS